ncbi:unnamed protein product [Paramecium sonneborni]|uniref:COMM domain-containing protein n=1 Tax=Paramecium sonneborni TaxID=65129 RepID=A0A8S1PJM4_9CILI|nr:unnamed protein product [Paramecium sonneborni]
MRFLFCGDSNCPEWFLAESALLTKIASVKMKLVTQYILQNLVEGQDTTAKIFKMLEGSGFNQQEINSTIACVSFIVENSAKYDVSEQVLIKELIDLGLPKENCEQLSKTFKQYKDKLQQVYEGQIIRVGKTIEFHYGISKFIVSESVAPQKQIDGNRFIDTNITFQHDNGKQECCQFVLFPEQLEDMLNSFKKAQKLMMQL